MLATHCLERGGAGGGDGIIHAERVSETALRLGWRHCSAIKLGDFESAA